MTTNLHTLIFVSKIKHALQGAGKGCEKESALCGILKLICKLTIIMWFGIDMDGFIFACTTAGTANVPEFVCKSKEQTELLADYFMETLETTTAEILETPYIDNSLINDAIILSKKGLFVFDAAKEKYIRAEHAYG